MCELFGLREKEEKTLFIIGNGFDLEHGIESKYADFKKWVEAQGDKQFVSQMEFFFSNKRDWWADIEAALGDYDEYSILDYCRPSGGIDYDHPSEYADAVEDSPDYYFKPVLDSFMEFFKEWVNSIDISFAVPHTQLSKQSLYLTFNYTETLEKVYGIPSSRVSHIHGSRLVEGNDYVIGHDSNRDTGSYCEEGDYYFEQNAKDKIVGWMNDLNKGIPGRIKRHSDFFCNLSEVETVIVIGHSLNAIDMPYFDEVIKNVSPSASWIINWFSKDDYKRANDFVFSRNIMNYNIRYRE